MKNDVTTVRPSPRRFPAWGLAVVMKWLQLSNARNMPMTVNIKLSIIVIAEIIPSTDDTCLLQSISPQNGPSKVNCTWTGGIPNSTPANHQCESIASILPVV